MLIILGCSKKNSKAFDAENSTPEELLIYADQVYNAGDYESAFLAYGVIFDQYPTSREYIDAGIGLSKCYVEFEKYEKSFDLLYNLLKENIIPSKVPQIYNAIAEFYERSAGISEQLTGDSSTDQKKAIEFYEKAITYPNSEDEPAKSYAQYKIGTLYENMAEYDEALKAFQKTEDDYPTQQWASIAQERMGIVQLKKEGQKALENRSGVQSDTSMQTSEKGKIIKAEETAKADTVKKAAPDTVKVVEPPMPKPTPADTTTEKKPKLDMD
jgi:tetratricopeptide (TPR) repeat protein